MMYNHILFGDNVLLTEKKLRKIIRGILLKENIKDKQSKAKEKIDTVNSLLSSLAKSHGGKMSSASSDIALPFSKGGKGVDYEAQGNFDMALANARLLGIQNNEIKSDDNYKKLIAVLSQFAEGSIAPDKGKGAVKKKKKKLPNPKIEEIQSLINKLPNIKDYEKNDLIEDGLWGRKTRSAVSNALHQINAEEIFSDLNLKDLTDDKLFSGLKREKFGGKKGGTWKELSIKLIDEEKNPGIKNPYDALLIILTNMVNDLKQNDPSPGPGAGEEKRKEKFAKRRKEVLDGIRNVLANLKPTIIRNYRDATNNYVFLDEKELLNSPGLLSSLGSFLGRESVSYGGKVDIINVVGAGDKKARSILTKKKTGYELANIEDQRLVSYDTSKRNKSDIDSAVKEKIDAGRIFVMFSIKGLGGNIDRKTQRFVIDIDKARYGFKLINQK